MTITPEDYVRDKGLAAYCNAVLRRARIPVDTCTAITVRHLWRGGWIIDTIDQPPRIVNGELVTTSRYMEDWAFNRPRTERTA